MLAAASMATGLSHDSGERLRGPQDTNLFSVFFSLQSFNRYSSLPRLDCRLETGGKEEKKKKTKRTGKTGKKQSGGKSSRTLKKMG